MIGYICLSIFCCLMPYTSGAPKPLDEINIHFNVQDSTTEISSPSCQDLYGLIHPAGSSWPSSDGCNTCRCWDGIISCTELPCVNEPLVDILKQEGESCGSCFCPPPFTAGTCEADLACVHNPLIMDAPGTCTHLCKNKTCGDECDTSDGMLQVMRYCQQDGSCGSNSLPECDLYTNNIGDAYEVSTKEDAYEVYPIDVVEKNNISVGWHEGNKSVTESNANLNNPEECEVRETLQFYVNATDLNNTPQLEFLTAMNATALSLYFANEAIGIGNWNPFYVNGTFNADEKPFKYPCVDFEKVYGERFVNREPVNVTAGGYFCCSYLIGREVEECYEEHPWIYDWGFATREGAISDCPDGSYATTTARSTGYGKK